MLNLAGSSYDYGNVLFAVLQECEHQRRALLPNEAEARLGEIARGKLAAIRESYEELGGAEGYWEELEREVLEVALPQYIPAAVEQNRLEKNNYDLWRQGDGIARALYAIIGLIVGVLVIKAPWIPIFEDTFASLTLALGFFYPEVKRALSDRRHTRFLNRLIAQAEKYQKEEGGRYVSEARLQKELDAVGGKPAARALTPPTPSLPSPPSLPHRERGGSKQR